MTPSNEDGSGSPKKSVADSSAPASSGFSLLSLSPKKMLSQVIAAALQEFFIIEDAAQQIQLLDRSNRINLTNLQLQPQVVLSKDGSCFKSKGVVEHVELSWVWGGNEQTSFIRDITLLVKGVQVTVVEEDYEDDGTETSDTTADNRSVASLNPSQPAPKDSKKAEGYFERYVQQMIDHLTLKIEDLQVVLEVENSEKIVVGIQSLCLLTLGKEEDGNGDSARILSQRISVDRFAVNIIAQGQKHPLLLPFGYAASVTRKSGKRFQDGFLTGLEVQGQVFYDANETASQSTDGQWTLRLGKQQARVVSNFMEMLSKYQQPSSSTPVQEDNERLDPKEEHQKDVQPREHGGNSQSTFIVLPLPALALVFDQSEGNAVRIDLPDCTFSCRLDMSLCQVTGGGTIMINQTCPLLQLPNGAEWVLDGVAKSMVVRQSQESFARDDDDIVVTHLNVEEAPLRRLVTTVMDVAAVINETTPSLDKEELWAGMEHAVTEEWAAWQEKNETAVFSFALQGRASLRMSSLGAKGTVEWLDAFLEASSFSVQSDGTVQKLHSGKFEVGPTSLGGASLIIPAGALHSDANSMAKFRFTDFVTATIDSAQVADNLKAFFMTFASISSELQEAPLELSRNDSVNLDNIRLPFFIQIPGLRGRVSSPLANFVIKTLNVSHTGNLAIEAVDAEIESGMKVSASGLQVALSERLEGSLGLLQVLEIPDVVACQDVTDVTFSFHESLLQIKLGSLALQLPEMQKPTATDSQTAVNIPFPLHLLADSIQTKVGKTGFDIITENVNLTAKPCGDILHFEHSNQLFVKVVHENGMGAVEMGVGTPGGDPTKLSVNINTMKIVEMECQSPNVSSLSFGKLDASALSLEFEPATNAIVLLGECNLYAESEQGAMKLKDCFQPLVDYFTDKESTEPGYCVKVPKAVVLMESPMQACTTLENVMYDGVNIVQVGQVHAHEKETDASSTLSGISVSMEPLSATIAMVEDILVPGAARLTDPIKDIQFWYKSGENTGVDELIIVLSAVKVALLQPQPVTETSLSPSKTPEPIELPCNIKYSIDVLSLLDTNFPNASPTVFEKLFGSVQMPAVDPFNPQQEIPKMAIMKGAFGSMQNDMLLLSNGQFHAETRDTSGEAFENVRFQAKDGMATAGFSSIDWDSMFGGKVANAPASVTRLGFCCIEPLEVGLKYKGVMVRTESRILIPKFVGHAQTTSDDVVQHFKSAILRRAPAFLAKANVLGANLGDSAASTAGMIAMAGSSVAGASGAAVAGIVAYDGVVAAIRSGKSARGVSEHEKYKFGDIVSIARKRVATEVK